mgnify:FL=1
MKKSFHQSVQRAMDSCFSGMQADPFLAQKIINDKEEKPVKRKLTLATVLVTLLIMLAVTALAMGGLRSNKARHRSKCAAAAW